MKFLAVVPAKTDSEGVALKAGRLVGGYPLVMWSVAAGRWLDLPVVVVTDTKYICEIVKYYKCDNTKFIIRPNQGDRYTIEEAAKGGDNLAVVYLRASTPLRNPTALKKYFREGVKYLEGGAYSVRSMHKMTEPCGKMYSVIDVNGVAAPYVQGMTHDEANSRRQDMPETYHPNGYIDIVRTKNISDSLFLEPFRSIITSDPYEIDTEEHLEYVQWVVEKKGHPLLDYMKGIF